jgi:hypothetical protein
MERLTIRMILINANARWPLTKAKPKNFYRAFKGRAAVSEKNTTTPSRASTDAHGAKLFFSSGATRKAAGPRARVVRQREECEDLQCDGIEAARRNDVVVELRPADTVARLGGDEFAVLLEGMTTADDADLVVGRIKHSLSAPMMFRGRETHVTASIGIAHADERCDAVDILRDADTAMYEAKAAGRGQHRESLGTGRATSSSRCSIR